MALPINTVQRLKCSPFSTLTLTDKKEVVRLGPDQPDLKPIQTRLETTQPAVKGKKVRRFSCEWYNRHTWLTACTETLKVYCFPCLLFSNSQRECAWTETGVDDWGHMGNKCSKHAKSEKHLENSLSLKFFGKTDIADSLSSAHRN